MKRCLSCNEVYPHDQHACPACQHAPVVIDGFRSYAPELAYQGGGFDPDSFSELAGFENSNFWFRARNQLISWAIGKYCPDFSSFLEVGCGTGYVLSGVSKAFNHRSLHGSEIFIAGLKFAAARLPSVDFMQMDARNIPYTEAFELIGGFDVLEHIDDDEEVMRQIHAALKPRGCFLITVPQHAWLWSPVDEHACHVRRYSSGELHHKLEQSGFDIVRSTSFVTGLLPIMILSRFYQARIRRAKESARAELQISSPLNGLFYQALRAELALIKAGCDLPVGGSLFVVARKAT